MKHYKVEKGHAVRRKHTRKKRQLYKLQRDTLLKMGEAYALMSHGSYVHRSKELVAYSSRTSYLLVFPFQLLANLMNTIDQ